MAKVHFGYDTIHLTCNIEPSARGRMILAYLQETKMALQAEDSDTEDVSLHHSGKFRFNLSRAGTKLYPYVLRSGDVAVLLSNRKFNSKVPNCKIEIGSMACWTSPDIIFHNIKTYLEEIGLKVHENKIGRFDLAIDLVGTDINDSNLGHPDYWIGRARNFACYYSTHVLTGISYGGRDILLRVYNKTHELRKNASKEEFFRELWGSEEVVTRIEFQVRREGLKSFKGNISSFEELNEHLAEIYNYLVNDWVRHASKKVDRKNKNQTKSELSNLWLQVVHLMPHRVKGKRNKPNLTKDVQALKKQARGLFVSIIASKNKYLATDHQNIALEAAKTVNDLFEEYFQNEPETFTKKYNQRLLECYHTV